MSLDGQVHGIGNDLQRHDHPRALPGIRAYELLAAASDPGDQDRTAVRQAPSEVVPKAVHATSGNQDFPGHAGDDTHRLCQTIRLPCRLEKTVSPRGA